MTSTVSLPVLVWTLTTAALIVWILFRPKQRAPWQILAMIAVFALEPFSAMIMNAENRAIPLKYDHFLQALDQALGISAFSVAHLLTPWAGQLFVLYQSLSFAMIAWYAWQLLAKNGKPRHLVYAYLLAYCLGPCLYLIVPACGPRHAYPGMFPVQLPNLELTLVPLRYWPNAMPSLHLTTALIFLMLARNTWMRLVGSLYVAGTVLATLAFEHYVIDLIVAFPFAAFATALARQRYYHAGVQACVLLAWLFLIRLATPFLVAHTDGLRLAALVTVFLHPLFSWDGWSKRFFQLPAGRLRPT